MTKYLALVDSGATVSTLPNNLFESITQKKRPILVPSDVRIKAGNDTAIDCLGMADVTVQIQDYEFEQRYYVCTNETIGVLGTDFLRQHAACMDFGREHLFLQGEWVPVYDEHGFALKKNRHVATLTSVRLPANRRSVIQARITQSDTDSGTDGELLMVYPRPDLWCDSKVTAAYSVGREHKRKMSVEISNPNAFDVVLKAGTLLGIVERPLDIQEYESHSEAPDTHAPGNEGARVGARAEVMKGIKHLRSITIEPEDDEFVPSHLTKMYENNKEGLDEEADRKFRWLLREFSDVFATDGYDLGSCNLVKHHIDTGDERPVKHRTRRTPQAQHEECSNQINELYKAGRVRPSNSPWGSNILLVKKKDGSWRMCVDYRELNTKTRNNDPYLLPRIDDTIDSLGRAKYFCTLDLIQGYHQVELTEESKPKTAFVVPRMNPSQWEFNYMPFGVQGGPATFQRLMDKLLQGLEHRVALAYLDDVIVFGATPWVCLAHLQLVFERLRAADLKLKPKKCEFFKKEILYLGHVVSGEGIKCDPTKVEAVQKWCRPRTARQVRMFLGTVNYYNRFVENFSGLAYPLFQQTRKTVKFAWSEECQTAFETLKQRLLEAPVMGYPQDEGLYILDTDASGFAIGAVLSQMQEQEGESEPVERVIAYGSRILHKCELRYCTRRRELLAIVHFAKVFRPYLYGRHVTIRTDHASLKYIKTMKDPNDQFMRWIERLEETEYEIVIRQGIRHNNADGLSRMPETTPPCEGKRCICLGVAELEANGDTTDDYTVLSPAFDDEQRHLAALTSWGSQCDKSESDASPCAQRTPKFKHQNDEWARLTAFTFEQLWTDAEMKEAQETDDDIALLYKCKHYDIAAPSWKDVSGGSAALGAYWHDYDRLEMHRGVLYRKWESRDGETVRYQLLLPYKYQELMARHFHDADTAAHMGRKRTFDQVHRRAFWYKMADDLRFWIQTCDICQRRKRQSHPPHAPQVIYTTGKVNERVSLDLCGPLIVTERGNKYVLVITDQFSKFTRAFAIPNKDTSTVATAFLRGWITLIGAPRQVHTDQGGEFGSLLFKQLCNMFKCEKTRTTAYHPSSDGTVERWNQTMMTMINALCKHEPQEWDQHLSHACQAYNSTKHSTTGIEPNRLMFTEMPYTPFDAMTPVPPGEQHLEQKDQIMAIKRRMRRMYQLAREKTNRAATAIKRYNDRKANFHQYHVGDIILIKSFKFDTGIRKMQDRFVGPYYVLDVIGNINLRVATSAKATPEIIHQDRAKLYYPRTPDQVKPDWVFKRSRRYQQHPPMVDLSTQIDEQMLQDAHNAQDSTVPEVRRTAQPSVTLQQQLDAANRADASLARGHVHHGEGTSLTDRLPVIEEEADEATLTSPHYSDNNNDELIDDVSRRSTQLSAPSPLIDAWGPRKSVKVRTPDENDVEEIQRRKRGRPTKRLTAVTTDPRHAVLLEIIECTRARAFVPLTTQSTAAASQTDF